MLFTSTSGWPFHQLLLCYPQATFLKMFGNCYSGDFLATFSNLLTIKIQGTTLWLPKASSLLLPLFHHHPSPGQTTGCENVGCGKNISRTVCTTEWTQGVTITTTKNRQKDRVNPMYPNMDIAYTKAAICKLYHMDYHHTRSRNSHGLQGFHGCGLWGWQSIYI